MEITIDPRLDAKNAELLQLVMLHRTSDVLQRINLWIVARTGKKLPEYIANGSSLEEKIKVIEELTEIMRTQDWSKLPTVPNGQASPSGTATKSAGYTPRIAPTVLPNPAAVPLVLAPNPVPISPAGAVPIPAPLKPAAQPASPHVVASRATTTVPQGDIAQQLAALIAQLVPQPVPAPAPSLGENDVRKIVRAELAATFSTFASVLIK